VAQASLLGSWSNESWLWAWANGSILKPVARAAREVKKLGKRLGVSELVEPCCFASAEHVERLAVVSRALLEAKGCYFPATATGKLVFVIHSIAEPNGA
jgi:hypothetical protein